jgi:hypothetical protein
MNEMESTSTARLPAMPVDQADLPAISPLIRELQARCRVTW